MDVTDERFVMRQHLVNRRSADLLETPHLNRPVQKTDGTGVVIPGTTMNLNRRHSIKLLGITASGLPFFDLSRVFQREFSQNHQSPISPMMVQLSKVIDQAGTKPVGDIWDISGQPIRHEAEQRLRRFGVIAWERRRLLHQPRTLGR